MSELPENDVRVAPLSGHEKAGLTPVRTARVIAGLVVMVDLVFIAIYKILGVVLNLANNAVETGLARYNNFTGRFAAQNFAEDKQLLTMLKDAQDLLPVAHVGVSILLVIIVVILLVALVGFCLPKLFIVVLVHLNLLKWTDDEGSGESSRMETITQKFKAVDYRRFKFSGAVFGGLFLLILVVICLHHVFGSSSEDVAFELEQKSIEYVNFQRDFFRKNGKVGDAAGLYLEAVRTTDAFVYKVGSRQFTAMSRMKLGECPEGSVWSISAASEGLFSKELRLYRKAPADTNCVKILPNYKNVGRKSK